MAEQVKQAEQKAIWLKCPICGWRLCKQIGPGLWEAMYQKRFQVVVVVGRIHCPRCKAKGGNYVQDIPPSVVQLRPEHGPKIVVEATHARRT